MCYVCCVKCFVCVKCVVCMCVLFAVCFVNVCELIYLKGFCVVFVAVFFVAVSVLCVICVLCDLLLCVS